MVARNAVGRTFMEAPPQVNLRRWCSPDQNLSIASKRVATVGKLSEADCEIHLVALTGEQLWERGLRLYEMEEYGDAEAAFRAGLDLDPLSPLLHSYLALCLCQQGLPEAAERSARRAVALDESFSGGFYALGLISLVNDKPRLALDALERCLELSPQNVRALSLTAQALLHTEQWQPALARALEALALDEDCVEAIEAYAIAQRALGEFGTAQELLLRYLAAHPGELAVVEQLGWVALELSDWGVALDCFWRAKIPEGVLETQRRQLPLFQWLMRTPRWLPTLAFLSGIGFCYLYPPLILPALGVGFVLVSLRPACNALLWWRRAPVAAVEKAECLSCAFFGLLACCAGLAGKAFLSGILVMAALGCQTGRTPALLMVAGMLGLAWGSLWHPELWGYFNIAFLPVIFLLTLIRWRE